MPAHDPPAIGDHAFLSDCHSLALVGPDASVEWACFHRFDARSVFARLLDRDIGGYFRIAPAGVFETTRRYLPGTNVLETRFRTPTGTVTVTDCLPVHEDPDHPGRPRRRPPGHLLLRRIHGETGEVPMEMVFAPRFDYGLTTPFLEPAADGLLVAGGGADTLLLQSDLLPLLPHADGTCTARATVARGEERYVALTHGEAGRLQVRRLPTPELRSRLQETTAFWERWTARCTYRGPYREAVVRSALVLKGLVYDRTGAIAAAATTSLPEAPGGERNWDYRYCWLRDSAAMLATLAGIGYTDEARRFGEWLLRTTAGRAEELQIMYGVGGERLLPEFRLEHLRGHQDSRPVRIGNGAWNQFQLDVYGEIVAAAGYLAERHGLPGPRGLAFLREVVDLAARRWEEPDEGIWEVRGGRRHFVFSKLMAWSALDCGVRLLERHGEGVADARDRERWARARDAIRARIESHGVDPRTGAFMQAFDSPALDAAALQLGLRGFLPFDDPRMRATVDRIDAELTRGGHCYRYRTDDGLPGDEGTFVFCTLWLVNALARTGRTAEAEERLALVLGCANDLGLLAEEIDPGTGGQLGNFPQGFSHLGVIAAALTLQDLQTG
ncbi:glycoside hydrolase family 15 protein [Streptomyces sp. NPDC001262]|uniref:glycoside hydrolase family 15 protein n=1 Tax=unclassified Streptomyces TaxID=2593676 RepID=UPI0036AA104A